MRQVLIQVKWHIAPLSTQHHVEPWSSPGLPSLAQLSHQRRPPNNPFATHSFTPADRGDLAANQRTAFKKKNRDTYSEGSNDEKTVSQELFKTPMN
jgi:hypothetical protein